MNAILVIDNFRRVGGGILVEIDRSGHIIPAKSIKFGKENVHVHVERKKKVINDRRHTTWLEVETKNLLTVRAESVP